MTGWVETAPGYDRSRAEIVPGVRSGSNFHLTARALAPDVPVSKIVANKHHGNHKTSQMLRVMGLTPACGGLRGSMSMGCGVVHLWTSRFCPETSCLESTLLPF